MKVSVNWLRDINRKYKSSADPMPDGIDALVEKIGGQLGAVDEVIDLGRKYEGIVVAKIVSCQKHPDADKLSICLIDDGRMVKGIKRDYKGLIQVVCGAPNARAGVYVAWIPPGVVVPSTAEKDPFKLEAKDIRGQTSNGMLASPKELALGDNHEGIIEIDEKVRPGQPFSQVYGLDDYIIDIENKMFTHRPDLFGMLGIAREVAGIQGHVFKSPAWYIPEAPLPAAKGAKLALTVDNAVQKLVPRFMMLPISQVDVKPSPMWLQTSLSRVGIRPINNVVDVTNFVMLETAQPLHAYDYDKLKKLSGSEANVKVRLSKAGEELTLLGGKRLKLAGEAIVIATDKQVIGLGGVMGGADTEVDENTKNIILEAGTFDMNLTRKSAMEYGLFTDAATRFTKGQSPLQNKAALSRAVAEIINLAGGRVAGPLADMNTGHSLPRPVNITSDFINQRLGLTLTASQIRKILESVEFKVTAKDEKLTVSAPFWRMDVEIPEDIVEEVGRLHGYDHLALKLPRKDLSPAAAEELLAFKASLRESLKAFGLNEVLTYSFVHGDLIENAGQDRVKAYHIRNALSPELQYYRLSIAPSLLTKVHPNIKGGYERFGLFELGKVHIKGVSDKQELPAMRHRLAVVLASKKSLPGAAYYQARKYTELIMSKLNIGCHYSPLTDTAGLSPEWKQAVGSFEPQRSAIIWSEKKKVIGLVGEPSQELRRSLKLPAHASMIEMDIDLMMNLSQPSAYMPLDKYPALEQDITLRVGSELVYGEVANFLNRQLEDRTKGRGYKFELGFLNIFQKENDKRYRQISWRLRLWHPARTLTTVESNTLLDELAASAEKEIGARRI